MDPVSAIAQAVGSLANAVTFIGAGKRQQRANQGPRYRIEDFQYHDNTSTILIIGLLLVLSVVVYSITKAK
ncbi:MAG: hypothetical protein AAGJ93_07070 [Bacteroidota bacterium]